RVTIEVRPTAGGTLTNVAQVSGAQNDPNSANNSVTQTINVTATSASSADLALSAAPLPASVDPGATLRYRLSATNGGPSTANGVTLADTLPANATLLTASATQGSCSTSAGSVSCAIGTLAVSPVLADHPAGYWRLGEPEGATTAADAVGTHSGTYRDVTLDAAGAVPGDSAASFAGAAAVSFPAGGAFDLPGALSLEAWIKPSVAGQYGGVFEKTIGGGVNTQYLLLVEAGRIEWRGRVAGGGYTTVIGPVLTVGSWSHVVGSYDGATLRLYVNGAAAGTATVGTLATGSGPAFLGHLGAEGGNPSIYPFSGAIDEVAVYGSALPAARVLAHFTGAQTNVSTARVTIEVRPSGSGTLVNSAQLSANEDDPNSANNSVTQSVNAVNGTADLKVTGVDAPDPVAVGGTLRYTLTIADQGNSSATNTSLVA